VALKALKKIQQHMQELAKGNVIAMDEEYL
jgi:hypothetical protein